MPIPADVRAFVADESLTRPDPFHSTWRAAFTAVAYGGVAAIALAVGNPLVWIVAIVAMSLLLLNNQAATHEAVHGNMYRSRWANDLAGIVWSAPTFAPYATYRAGHLDHHRFTHEARDTEPLDVIESLTFYFLVFPFIVAAYTFKLYVDEVKTLLGKPPAYVRTAHQRRLVRLNALAQLVMVAVLVAWGVADWTSMVLVWAVPFVVSNFVIFAAVVLPEHYGCRYGPGSPFVTTRTTMSNPVIRFLFWGTNFHTAHHLVPSVPSQKLHLLHEVIADRCEHVAPGYARYHLDLVRSLARGEVAEAYEVDLRDAPIATDAEVDEMNVEYGLPV